ncbi:MAG TPA: PIN domain-containing protein [Gemmatimonadota bacterium]|nr:PIN domain-containing protein [Gemmatimonadota bacterium]
MGQVYLDTSAFYAAVVRDDANHVAARETFARLMAEGAEFVTSSYVVQETAALLQNRWGIEAVRDWQRLAEPGLAIHWVEEDIHERALIALLAAGERRISLADWSSFEIIRELGIETAFTFDRHFRNRGFEVVPG